MSAQVLLFPTGPFERRRRRRARRTVARIRRDIRPRMQWWRARRWMSDHRLVIVLVAPLPFLWWALR